MVEWKICGYMVRLIRGLNSEWESYEKELEKQDIFLPLNHRNCWIKGGLSSPDWFLVVFDGDGKCCCGMGIEIVHRRALPGTLILRVDPFGETNNPIASEAAIIALKRLAQTTKRVLRVHISTYSLNEDLLYNTESLLDKVGYHRSDNPKNYQETVTIDLTPTLERIFRSFHPTARRHIRAIDKLPAKIIPITDPQSEIAISSLINETMARTGGNVPRVNWARRIEFSVTHPTLSRIVGLYTEGEGGEERLLAFAWGCTHGRYTQYSAAASTRSDNYRIPMGYVLAWDLICWAKRLEVATFDFGGITKGSHESGNDPLGGISDFKRYFTTRRRVVSSEWIYEPRPWLAKAVDLAGALGRRVLNSVLLADKK